MSYIAFFLLIIAGCVLGAPILQESIQYHLIECVSNENDTLSKQIIELTNFNETCIRVNKSSASGDEIYLYMIPESETNFQIQITTENCSASLPNVYLSSCSDETHDNNTEIMVTYPYRNISSTDTVNDNENTSTNESNLHIDSMTYQTLINFHHDSSEDEDHSDHNDLSNYD